MLGIIILIFLLIGGLLCVILVFLIVKIWICRTRKMNADMKINDNTSARSKRSKTKKVSKR